LQTRPEQHWELNEHELPEPRQVLPLVQVPLAPQV
jgi:hypothetical protein